MENPLDKVIPPQPENLNENIADAFAHETEQEKAYWENWDEEWRQRFANMKAREVSRSKVLFWLHTGVAVFILGCMVIAAMDPRALALRLTMLVSFFGLQLAWVHAHYRRGWPKNEATKSS